MILRGIGVAGWRCFPDPVEVGAFGDGLNIVHAPNASGKSTLFEALKWALFDSHGVGGEKAKSLRPWGRALTPRVHVEFVHGGAEYRISKQFLDKASSELSRKEDGRFVRLAEGDAADERTRSILLGKPSLRGPCSSANSGVCQVLWAPQGGMELVNLSEDLVANIQQSMGVQVSGGGAMGLLDGRIDALYATYFTDHGKLKTGKDGPRLSGLRADLKEKIAERTVAVESVGAFEEASRRVEDLRAARLQARLRADELTRELEKTRREATEYLALVTEKNERAQKAEACEAKHFGLRRLIDGIAKARKELGEVRHEVEKLEADVPLQRQEVKDREKEAGAAKAALEQARRLRGRVETAERESKLADQCVRSSQDLAEVTVLLGKINDSEKTLRELRDQRSALVAPGAGALRAIRETVKKRNDAMIRLDAALITLEIVPEVDVAVEVISPDHPASESLSKGGVARYKDAPEVVVDLVGIARLRARGPAGTVEELRDEVTRTTEKLAKQTLEYGTTDVARLEDLNEKAQELDRRVSEAEKVLETLLAGRTPDEVQREHSRTTAAVEELLSTHEEWRKELPDAAALEAEAVRVKNAFIKQVEDAEAKWDAAQSALRSAGDRHASLEARLDTAKKRADSLREELAELESDGRDDAARAEEIKSLALEWEAAGAGLEKVVAALEKMGDDPARSVEKLEASLASAGDAATEALEKEKAEEGRLQQLAGEGNYTRLSVIEEGISVLEEEVAGEELRASAIKLLHDTVKQCRGEALAEISRPVEEMATGMIRRIAGGRLGEVVVSDKFSPRAVTPGVADGEEISIGDLSGGEQEQVHFAVRMALAGVLARDERQMVVLDDALAVTDTGRFARVLSIIEDSVEKLQVIVLTCHPEKYRALSDAEFFDLEQICSRES